MTQEIAIRLAMGTDVDMLSRLVASFRDHLGQANPPTATLAGSLGRLLRDPDAEFLLAMDGANVPLGYSQLRFRYSLWVDGIEAHLDDMFVVVAARGRGVGRRLLSACIQRARERSARIIAVNTNERNNGALRLYERTGFRAQRSRWEDGRQLWLELEL